MTIRAHTAKIHEPLGHPRVGCLAALTFRSRLLSVGPRAPKVVMTTRSIENALEFLRGEYLEVPRLALTLPQAVRLLDLDEQTAAAILDALTESHFLRRRPDGRYVRAAPGKGRCVER